MRLVVKDPEYLKEVRTFADSVGAAHALELRLQYLEQTPWADEVILYRDFAPYSFYIEWMKDGQRAMNGGLIYRGPGVPHDGSGPAFTVSLDEPEATHSWSIHT